MITTLLAVALLMNAERVVCGQELSEPSLAIGPLGELSSSSDSLSSQASLTAFLDELPTQDITPVATLPAVSEPTKGTNAKLAGYQSITACDCGPGSCDGLSCGIRGRRRWFFQYESVLLHPLQQNDAGVIVERTDDFSHIAFPWEIKHSPRFTFGSRASGDELGWQIRYWQFRHSESFLANDANGLIPAGTVATVGYLAEDGDISTGLSYVDEGDFRSSIRTDVLDFEFQRQLARPLNLTAGLRYAKVAQGYLAIVDPERAWGNSEFRGVGPTVALRFMQPTRYPAFSLFADVRGSMLLGRKTFSAGDNVNPLGQSIGEPNRISSGDTPNALVNNAEVRLGVQCSPIDQFILDIAFECQYFDNVGGPNPTAVFAGIDNGLSGDSPLDDSLGFAGLTIGTTFLY